MRKTIWTVADSITPQHVPSAVELQWRREVRAKLKDLGKGLGGNQATSAQALVGYATAVADLTLRRVAYDGPREDAQLPSRVNRRIGDVEIMDTTHYRYLRRMHELHREPEAVALRAFRGAVSRTSYIGQIDRYAASSGSGGP